MSADPIWAAYLGSSSKELTSGGMFNTKNMNVYNYTYHNPVRYTDPDGNAVETGWDIFNVAIGVGSFGVNLFSGNFIGAGVDLVGVVVDVGATVIPGVPGGAGSAIKASRATKKAATLARNRSIGKLAEGEVTKALAKKFAGSKVGSQITARFKDGSKVVFDNVVVGKNGKLQLINETKSGGAVLSKAQKRFFENGESVKFVGDKADKLGLLGKSTNKAKTKSQVTKVKVNVKE